MCVWRVCRPRSEKRVGERGKDFDCKYTALWGNRGRESITLGNNNSCPHVHTHLNKTTEYYSLRTRYKKIYYSFGLKNAQKTRLLQSPTDLDYSTRKRGEDYFR